jgi:hypothetical protein
MGILFSIFRAFVKFLRDKFISLFFSAPQTIFDSVENVLRFEKKFWRRWRLAITFFHYRILFSIFRALVKLLLVKFNSLFFSAPLKILESLENVLRFEKNFWRRVRGAITFFHYGNVDFNFSGICDIFKGEIY